MYFMTFTVIDWVDVFSRKDYKLEPVEAMLLEEPQHYLFSSAKDYYGEKGMVEIEILH